jgi:3-methyladenine DNA glycosylase AlkD
LQAGEVLLLLKEKAKTDQLESMARYGMSVNCRLGVSVPDLRSMAKTLGKGHLLALDLWHTGFSEARILAAMVDEVELAT